MLIVVPPQRRKKKNYYYLLAFSLLLLGVFNRAAVAPPLPLGVLAGSDWY